MNFRDLRFLMLFFSEQDWDSEIKVQVGGDVISVTSLAPGPVLNGARDLLAQFNFDRKDEFIQPLFNRGWVSCAGKWLYRHPNYSGIIEWVPGCEPRVFEEED